MLNRRAKESIVLYYLKYYTKPMFSLNQLLNSSLTLLIFFILLFAYTKLAGPILFNINSVTTSKTDSFQVTGEGKATLKPDSATIRVGVVAKGQTAKAAQDQMNENINKVIEAIKALGIPESDIKTQNYNVNPVYDYSEGQKITNYSANTNITIKVKNVDLVNKIIDAATSNGANVVGGAEFENLDKTQAENEARSKAITDAKNKAQNIAKTAGFSLGRLIGYQEGFVGEPRPLTMLAADSKTQIEPGTNEVTVTVTLSYEVR